MKKDWGDIIFRGLMIFLLILLIFAGGYYGICIIHDWIFVEKFYKEVPMVLDDIQYLDNGNVMYRFGDKIIKDDFIGKEMFVNRTYGVVYIMYKNSWLEDNDKWEYKEIEVG